MSVFQDNLRQYREKLGINAKDFAAQIGVKYTTYINYETQGREPRYDILIRIAAALNVSIDELLGHKSPSDYENYKKRLKQIGLDIYEEPDGKILVRLNEKGTKEHELVKAYEHMNLYEKGLPNRQALMQLVDNATAAIFQGPFRDAIMARLVLPWYYNT